MARKNFIPLLQASLQGCVIETPHSQDIRDIVGVGQCADVVLAPIGGFTGPVEGCGAVSVSALVAYMSGEGWTASATPTTVSFNGDTLLMDYIMACDYSALSGALRNDLCDAMNAQGYCAGGCN